MFHCFSPGPRKWGRAVVALDYNHSTDALSITAWGEALAEEGRGLGPNINRVHSGGSWGEKSNQPSSLYPKKACMPSWKTDHLDENDSRYAVRK